MFYKSLFHISYVLVFMDDILKLFQRYYVDAMNLEEVMLKRWLHMI